MNEVDREFVKSLAIGLIVGLVILALVIWGPQ